MSVENPNFLKKKYDLHKTPEVESAAKRTEARSGEDVPQDPVKRIQNYLDRFKEITERTDPEKRERGMDVLKQVLHDEFIIKPKEIPESYFETQRRIAREQGHGDVEITEDMRQQLAETIITDQKMTLDGWIDYLASPDATYPDWLKYYAFRSVLGLSSYDKEKHEFGRTLIPCLTHRFGGWEMLLDRRYKNDRLGFFPLFLVRRKKQSASS